MTDLWVVFDGSEPDSAVIGLATSLDAVVEVIGLTVKLCQETLYMRLPYSDKAVITAEACELYTTVATPREWFAEKHSVIE